MKKHELESCPFCGATEEEQNVNVGWVIECDAWQVSCDNCGASGGMHDGRAEAIDAWNMRA